MAIAPIRPAVEAELRLLRSLLSFDFPGHEALLRQLDGLSVQPVFDDGTLDLFPVEGSELAKVDGRVVLTASYLDAPSVPNGPRVNILIHVVNGVLNEMEVYKDDGTPIVIAAADMDVARMSLTPY